MLPIFAAHEWGYLLQRQTAACGIEPEAQCSLNPQLPCLVSTCLEQRGPQVAEPGWHCGCHHRLRQAAHGPQWSYSVIPECVVISLVTHA